MKIKTITCHDVYNVGASLQAYALAEYLKELGHDIEIINYKPEYLFTYKLTGVGNSRYDYPILRELYQLAKLPGRIKNKYGKRKKEFDEFTKKYLPVTEKKFTSNEDLKKNLPKADVYFAGSDQIWNTIFNNGKDPAFYLDFAPKSAIKASYAASFATEDVLEEWKARVQQWLKKLDYISVRESSGVEIVKKLGIERVQQVVDPVFLLDSSKWEILEKKVNNTEPYILIYDFDNNQKIYDFAKNLAKKNGWKIYSLLKNKECDRSFENEGPESFLWLVHHAEFVISNSFHATAFSIIFQKQFVVFQRIEKINTRMRDLLMDLNLDRNLTVDENIKNIGVINYSIVDEIVKSKIDISKTYIDKVISGDKNEKENFVCN